MLQSIEAVAIHPPAARPPAGGAREHGATCGLAQGPSAWSVLAAALDQVDYGMLVIAAEGTVAHVNLAALDACGRNDPLRLENGVLRAHRATDNAALQLALRNAAERCRRGFLTLGETGRRIGVSIVPLAEPVGEERAPTLIMLGKQEVCEQLSIEGYARGHGLTSAETRVLSELCQGRDPGDAAARIGVAISTVRSQIGTIRMKTGAESIRSLLQRLAALPPMVRAVRSSGRAGAPQGYGLM